MKTISFLFCFFLVACASQPSRNSASATVSTEQSNLSLVDAQKRSASLSDIRYALSLTLDQTSTYRGQETIQFILSKNNEDLRLDFFQGEITAIEINGVKSEAKRTPTYLELQKSLLKVGANVVKLAFTTQMQTDGTGLHRFEDPQDHAVYVYTQFEAYYAHKFMPCFDQPDLKAILTMQVTAPAKWTMVSATRETSIDTNGDSRTWHFPETQPLSTYLFSLHGGPFRVWESNFESTPLRLFARPSLAKYVNAELWFRTTKQGLGFYNKFFGYPYAFKKYDQLLVPEFNAGAMENAAAVTFSERYVRRGRMSREDQRDVASVVLHEMAHMWFGDLVTMRWWNDLWLNESFATYMSQLAMFEATPFKESWTEFFSGTKLWAYYQDQLSTTHPIESEIPDTLAASSAFDGITYGKGASVLKQMRRWLSPEAFKSGVQDYMKIYAFKNAELNNFIGALQKHSPRDLVGWSKNWLQQAGLDTVRVAVTCQGEKLEKVTLTSTASVPGNFRAQSLALGIFKVRKGTLVLLEAKPIEMNAANQEYRFDSECPDFVYPNFADHGYMKVVLDPKSIAVLSESISTMPDPLSRLMVWANLWQMMLDQEISVTDYAKIAASQLSSEKDEDVLHFVVGTISGSNGELSSVIGYWPTQPPAMAEQRAIFTEKMEGVYLQRLKASKPGSDIQTFWWASFVKVARSKGTLTLLVQSLTRQPFVRGLSFDQDRRWAVVNLLCRRGVDACKTLIAAEEKRDGSDRGLRAALGARAIFPDYTSKELLLREALSSNSLSLQKRTAIARNLFPYDQKETAIKMESLFFDYVRQNKHSSDFEVFETLATTLSSLNCTSEQANKLEEFMQQNQDLPSPILRDFRESLDEDQRCSKIRAKAGAIRQAS